MNAIAALLVLAFADPAPTVDIATLSLKHSRGELISADAAGWKLRRDGQEETVAIDDILTVEVLAAAKPASSPALQVMLMDGSKLNAAQVGQESDAVTIESSSLGAQKLARAAVSSIRFAASPSLVDASWIELLQRERRQDLLVVKKGDVLDFVEGVVSKITANEVQVLLDKEPVTLKREKVFGVIYFQKAAATQKPSGLVELVNGDRLFVRRVSASDGQFVLSLMSGAEAKIPLSDVQRLDLSLSKTWLSDLKPRDVKYEPSFLSLGANATPLDAYRADYDVDTQNRRLQVRDKEFHRGVSIRSKTLLRYRLNGDYARLRSWMGIQKGFYGDVHVELSLDGQKVLAADVLPEKEPQAIDLDVSGKFVLDVLVDYGANNYDVGDHLVLGHARLTK